MLFGALLFMTPFCSRAGEQPFASDCATVVASGWKHRVWSIYPIEKLKANETLALAPCAERLELTVAQNERESFVLALRSDVPLRDITLLHAPDRSDFPMDIQIHRLGYVYVSEPSGTHIKQKMPYPTGTGEYPDPVLIGTSTARPNRNTQFLVTLHVPRSVPPGCYDTRLVIRFRHEGWMPVQQKPETVVHVRATVRSFALPMQTPLFNTSVASWHMLPAWLNRPDIQRDLLQTFSAANQAPDPLPSPRIQRTKEGTLTVDTTAWERAAEAVLENGHASHLFLPVWSHSPDGSMQGVYFLWHYPAVTNQHWQGATICRSDGALTDDFRKLFGAYLQQMYAVLMRRHWLDRIYITTMDEPYTYHLHDAARHLDTPENNYRVISNFVQFVRHTAPGLRTFATADPTPALNGLIDLWCLRNLKHAAAARERADNFGERVIFCDNYRTLIDYPAISARSLGWLAWKLGASGWLTYETLGDFTRTWEGPCFVYPSFGSGSVWGMGQLFYPDPSGSGRIATSLRWELMREGCDDYAYLWLLRERLQHLPASYQTHADVHAAKALLDSSAEAVVGGSGDVETDSTEPAPNATRTRIPHELRKQIGDLIERIDAIQHEQ